MKVKQPYLSSLPPNPPTFILITAMEAGPEVLELLMAMLFAASLVFGLCASAVICRSCTCTAKEDEENPSEEKNNEQPKRLGGLSQKIVESLRWGRSGKIGESSLLQSSLEGEGGESEGDGREGDGEELRVQSSSPVWQRRILMGERCEFPRFSGLILYDEKGAPLGGGISSEPRYSVSKVTSVNSSLSLSLSLVCSFYTLPLMLSSSLSLSCSFSSFLSLLFAVFIFLSLSLVPALLLSFPLPPSLAITL